MSYNKYKKKKKLYIISYVVFGENTIQREFIFFCVCVFYSFIYLFIYFFTLQYCIGFAIHGWLYR